MWSHFSDLMKWGLLFFFLYLLLSWLQIYLFIYWSDLIWMVLIYFSLLLNKWIPEHIYHVFMGFFFPFFVNIIPIFWLCCVMGAIILLQKSKQPLLLICCPALWHNWQEFLHIKEPNCEPQTKALVKPRDAPALLTPLVFAREWELVHCRSLMRGAGGGTIAEYSGSAGPGWLRPQCCGGGRPSGASGFNLAQLVSLSWQLRGGTRPCSPLWPDAVYVLILHHICHFVSRNALVLMSWGKRKIEILFNAWMHNSIICWGYLSFQGV